MARKRYKPEEIVAKLRLKQVEDSLATPNSVHPVHAWRVAPIVASTSSTHRAILRLAFVFSTVDPARLRPRP
jgi:hypothetical protein